MSICVQKSINAKIGQDVHAIDFRRQSIHLREKNIVGPTERSKNALAFFKLAEEDLRFSMKMMFAPDYGPRIHPVRTAGCYLIAQYNCAIKSAKDPCRKGLN